MQLIAKRRDKLKRASYAIEMSVYRGGGRIRELVWPSRARTKFFDHAP